MGHAGASPTFSQFRRGHPPSVASWSLLRALSSPCRRRQRTEAENLTRHLMTRTLSWKTLLTPFHPRTPVLYTASVSWSRPRQAWRKVPRAIVAVRNSWRVRMEPRVRGCVTSTPTSPTTHHGPLCPPCGSEEGRSQVAPVRSGSHSSSELGGDGRDHQLNVSL